MMLGTTNIKKLHLFHILPWQSRIYTLGSDEIMRSDGANSSMTSSDEGKNREQKDETFESESVLSDISLKIKET